MKKLRNICLLFATFLMAMVTLAGCTFIKSQPMRRVKGTYHLTSYSITNGKTGAVTDYLEKYGYQAYLIVTGDSKGYYVYKDNETSPCKREVFLRYVYNEDETNKVSEVEYSFDGKEFEHFGVTRDALNYSRPSTYISDNWYTNGYSKYWDKVDGATDLSYVNGIFSNIQDYVPEEATE
jgi:hypothetical protein